jgi:hypothetical protein
MKTMFKLLGIIAIAAVIGFSMLSCRTPAEEGDGTLPVPVLPPITGIPTGDRNPKAPSSITTNAADIPNLPAAILDRDDVTPMTDTFLKEMYDKFNSEFQEMLSLSRGARFNRNTVYSRAFVNPSAVNVSEIVTLKQLMELLPEDILSEIFGESFNISNVTLNGHVRYAVSAASADDYPLHALADTRFFISTPGTFDTDRTAGVIGEVAGVGEGNIHILDLDRISGSLAASASFAVNVLYPIYDYDDDYWQDVEDAYIGSMWVKLIGSASISSNFTSTGTSSISASLNIKAFGENDAEIGALDLTGTVSMTGDNVSITITGSILGDPINETVNIVIED